MTGARETIMWPREHGAYGQLAFPLITGLACAGLHAPAVLVTVAAVSGFLTHEPLLVLLGRRGPRIQPLERDRATTWLRAGVVVAAATGLCALWLAPPGARWTFAFPLVPAVIYGVAVARHAEKSTGGELAAAFAFSLVPVPMCVAAGVSFFAALSVGMAFAVLSVANTLGVRVVILRVRGGGDPVAVLRTRLLLVCVVVATMTAIGAVTFWASLSWMTGAAILPGLLVSLALAFRPPSPARLRSIGWTLMSTSALATLLMVFGLRVP